VLALFNEVFAVGNPDFVPRTLHHWRWQFPGNPEGHQTFVAEAGGRIVGQYTAVPGRWRTPAGVALGAQALDTCIAAEYRRSLRKSGLFLTLAGAWFDHYGRPERDHLVYGFPNPQAFRIGTRRVGYRPVRCPQPELSLEVPAAGALDPGDLEVSEIEEFGTEVDAFDAALAPALGISTVRDARYLNWRYARHPSTRYRLLRAAEPDGRLRGFLVHGLGWHGDRKDIAPVVDWLVEPGDTACFRALLGAAGRAARAAGLGSLLAWAPPRHRHFADLVELGFRPADSRFNLCIRIFTESFDLEDAIEHWYILMGDSDIY
jgi:hypothetical protein